MIKKSNKIKILCMIFCSLLLSGCNVDYKLDIAKDGSITEDINWQVDLTTIGDDFSKDYYNRTSESIYNSWLINLEDYGMKINAFKKYNNTYVDETDKKGILLNAKYDNLKEYAKSSNVGLFVKINELRETTNRLIYDVTFNNQTLYADYIFTVPEMINITITCPYDVIETNAKVIEKNIHTYKWVINPNDKTTDIKIVFDKKTGTIFASKYRLIVGIIAITILLLVSIIVISNYKRYNNFKS